MELALQQDLLKGFQDGLTAFDDRPIHEWASDNVKLSPVYSAPGYFSAEKSRYMIKPLEALKDLRFRQINLMASPRCGKSLIAELFLLYTIVNNSGTTGWFGSSDEQMEKFAELRLVPLLSSCKLVKELLGKDKYAVTKRRFIFPHMTVGISSAKIKALQSIGYKTLIGDECWIWDTGFIGEAKARLGDFLHTSKLLLLSQGGEEGDDWTTEFNRGCIHEWAWKCPSCAKLNTYDWNKQRDNGTFAGVVWDSHKDSNGLTDISAASKSARFECIHCGFQLVDNPQNRRHMNDNGDYVLTKAGDDKVQSFRWNAMANIEVPLSTLVQEYLYAKDQIKRVGNTVPLKEFYQKRLAKSFLKNDGRVEMTKLIAQEYDTTETGWDYKFLTIDCQNNFTQFYYVIREWKKTGESRLISHGSVPTWADLRNVQQINNIRDQNTFIDSGNFATQVYAKCLEYGHSGMYKGRKVFFSWIALKGYDAESFDHPDGVKRIFSTESRGDPNLGKDAKGKTCPLFRWSNYSIKNILTFLRDGKGVSWLINTNDEEYHKQMNSEILTPEIDKRTNRERYIWVQRSGIGNHYWDCEAMQIVAAAIVGIVGNTFAK